MSVSRRIFMYVSYLKIPFYQQAEYHSLNYLTELVLFLPSLYVQYINQLVQFFLLVMIFLLSNELPGVLSWRYFLYHYVHDANSQKLKNIIHCYFWYTPMLELYKDSLGRKGNMLILDPMTFGVSQAGISYQRCQFYDGICYRVYNIF